jgi:hypothetical protein
LVSLQIHRISLFVCFSPGIAVQFYIDEVKVGLTFAASAPFDSDALLVQWDHSKPSTIGAPLRIGSSPHFQDFDELAEVIYFGCLIFYLIA